MELFIIQKSALPFRGRQLNFQIWLQNFDFPASKLNLDGPLTSMASKTALTIFLKIASNHSKYWWECVPLSFYSLWFTLWSVSLHIRWMVKRWIGWLKIGTSCHGKYSVVSINSRTFSKVLHSWFNWWLLQFKKQIVVVKKMMVIL